MASPTTNAAYLNRLLDRQPACLIRVRLDGVCLACNDAALNLFGVPTLRAILNTNVMDRIAAAERANWASFATRVWANGASSLECHLAIDGAEPRPVVFQAIALRDHPDGRDSVLVNVRDQLQARSLERSIQAADQGRAEQEKSARTLQEELERTRGELERTREEGRRLAALIEEHRAARQRLTDALAAERANRDEQKGRSQELERKIEQGVSAARAADRGYREQIAALEAELEKTRAALSRTQATSDKRALDQRQRAALVEVSQQVFKAAAEQHELAARLEQVESERDRLIAEHRLAMAEIENSKGKALVDLRSQLSGAVGEQTRLTTRLEEVESERDRLRVEHQRAVAALEAGKSETLAELRSQLAQAWDEERRLVAAIEEHERDRDRASAEHHQAVAGLELAHAEAVADMRAQLAEASAEATQLRARIGQREQEIERLTAAHRRAILDLEASKREALADCERILTDIQQALFLKDRAPSDVERRLADEIDQALDQHASAQRLVEMKPGLISAVSAMRSVLADAAAEVEHTDAIADDGSGDEEVSTIAEEEDQ